MVFSLNDMIENWEFAEGLRTGAIGTFNNPIRNWFQGISIYYQSKYDHNTNKKAIF